MRKPLLALFNKFAFAISLKQMLIANVIIMWFVVGILKLLSFRLETSIMVGALIILSVVIYWSKRRDIFEVFTIGFEIHNSEYGDVIQLSIIAIDHNENVTYLNTLEYHPLCYIDFLKTYELVEDTLPLYPIENSDIVLLNGYKFGKYDQANYCLYSFSEIIRNVIKANLVYLRTGFSSVSKSEVIKKRSRLFGIFRS